MSYHFCLQTGEKLGYGIVILSEKQYDSGETYRLAFVSLKNGLQETLQNLVFKKHCSMYNKR
mgnify:FL=1